jgi:branched-chain amino acid transport system ATP-binding protein
VQPLEDRPADSATSQLLEVRGVRAGYGSVSVLDDVSITVGAGEAVTVLGPNGAGKTTLLRVISGVIPPRAGAVEGRAVGRRRRTAYPHQVARGGIGHVPEGRGVFPGLSVDDNLALGTFGRGKRAGVDAEETMAFILELFPWLPERSKQAGGTLSGGVQQMVAIARALMGDPRLLMLDEPSLGLSPLMVTRVFEALAKIRERGVAILLVEQNLAHALKLADRGYVMNRGQIVLGGSAAELRESDMFSHFVAME